LEVRSFSHDFETRLGIEGISAGLSAAIQTTVIAMPTISKWYFDIKFSGNDIKIRVGKYLSSIR